MSAIHYIARGDAAPAVAAAPPLRSLIAGVSDAAWTRFVRALQTRPISSVTESNGLGCFEMRPRRLADLGLMVNLRYIRRAARQVWDGDFVAPLTLGKFLGSFIAQYNALGSAVERWVTEGVDDAVGNSVYNDSTDTERSGMPRMTAGRFSAAWRAMAPPAPSSPPLTRSGILAVLHRAGPGGLAKWGQRQYEATQKVVAAANGIF